MSQGSVVLPTTGTVSGLTMTQDTNTAIATLITNNSGASAPTTTSTGLAGLAGVFWHDTTNNLLKIRDQADTTWITVGGIDETGKIWLSPIGGGVATIASASTVNLGSVPQTSITISGTTAITSFGSSMLPGQSKLVSFSGALTLTYNATSLILPGSANITTANGDMALVTCKASGNYRVAYFPISSGLPAQANGTLLGNISGSSAVPSASTLTAIIDAILGSTQGDILYHGASAWAALAPGTSGNVLQTGGAGANPSWVANTSVSVTAGATWAIDFGGLKIKGGSVSLSAHASSTVTFASAFPTSCDWAIGGASNLTSSGTLSVGVSSYTANDVTVYNSDGGTTQTVSWIAVGH